MIPHIEQWIEASIVEALVWTLVHFLWQGAAVALLLAGVLALLRKHAPAARYAAACVALGMMVLLPAGTLAFLAQRQALPTSAPAGPPLARMEAPAVGLAGEFELERPAALAGPPAVSRADVLAASGDASAPPHTLKDRLRPALPWLVGGWLVGVLALSVRLAGGWVRLRIIQRTGSAAPRDWEERLAALMQRMGIGRPVQLLAAGGVETPCALGWIKPIILVPAGMLCGLPAQQVEAILAHELAHIRRHDYLVNLLQSAAEALLFYHPAVWWVSRRIRVEREYCCDDIAAEVCGSPLQYARALTALEEMRSVPASLAPAASGGSLLGRIRRLLGRPETGPAARPWAGSGIALMAIVLTLLLLSHTRTDSAVAKSEGDDANVDVAALVREVRRRELWVDNVESLRIHAEATLVEAGKPAEPEAHPLKEKVDVAFDRKRLNVHWHGLSASWPTREYRQLWNGGKIIGYHVARDGKREYALDKDFSATSARVFHYLAWPRQAPHAHWWEPEEHREGEADHGRPEDYRLAGREQFRGVECYVLETDIFSRTLYVGVADGHLYGVHTRVLPRSAEQAATRIRLEIAREQGRLIEDWLQYLEWERSLPPEQQLAVLREYLKRTHPLTVPWLTEWYADWREVQPGRWVPMRQGYYWWDRDDPAAGQGTREVTITHIAIDQPLPDDLFKIEFEEGVQMYDWSHDPPLFYPYKKDRTPEEWQVIIDEGRRRHAEAELQRHLDERRIR